MTRRPDTAKQKSRRYGNYSKYLSSGPSGAELQLSGEETVLQHSGQLTPLFDPNICLTRSIVSINAIINPLAEYSMRPVRQSSDGASVPTVLKTDHASGACSPTENGFCSRAARDKFKFKTIFIYHLHITLQE
ncbi:hypothetical protein J6590_060087 [Homalodisca vitripennis]|nr:hypothetical protein J6590_060087 [Homalodisca vitripennis]